MERKIKNRQSAERSRQRKLQYFKDLELQNERLVSKVASLETEIADLHRQLGEKKNTDIIEPLERGDPLELEGPIPELTDLIDDIMWEEGKDLDLSNESAELKERQFRFQTQKSTGPQLRQFLVSPQSKCLLEIRVCALPGPSNDVNLKKIIFFLERTRTNRKL